MSTTNLSNENRSLGELASKAILFAGVPGVFLLAAATVMTSRSDITWERLLRSYLVEAIRAQPGAEARIVLVTTPRSGSGTSTVAAYLAAGLAGEGVAVLLVDANLHTPAIHRLLNLPNDNGFADALRSEGYGVLEAPDGDSGLRLGLTEDPDLIVLDLMLPGMDPGATAPSPMAGARIVLCLALLGAVLGFLPHNFNPASIFLGDCGSLLLGYLCVVIIIMFGEQGQTHLVFAGLIVFSLPILDTALTILRRWIAGTPMSAADDKHIHHRLKRILGGVKRAVLALYGISFLFAVVGVTLAALVVRTELQVRVVYAIALVLFGFIGVIAVKSALRQRVLSAGSLAEARPSRPANAGSRDPGDGGEGPPPEPKASSS